VQGAKTLRKTLFVANEAEGIGRNPKGKRPEVGNLSILCRKLSKSLANSKPASMKLTQTKAAKIQRPELKDKPSVQVSN
jgi:hypothetical protein